MNKVFTIMLILVSMTMFSAIFPYPVFSNFTNITEKENIQILDYNETEIEAKTNENSRILDLEFDEIDTILPQNSVFEIIDIQTEKNFNVFRTGGYFHIDFEPKSPEDYQTFYEICNYSWSWEKRPVLIKINENSFVPASMSCYPHGYSNNLGHFCLHFKSSKTDGTKTKDYEHQKNIKKALKFGAIYIKNKK